MGCSVQATLYSCWVLRTCCCMELTARLIAGQQATMLSTHPVTSQGNPQS